MTVSPAEPHNFLLCNENVNALEATKNSFHTFAWLVLCCQQKKWSDWSTGNEGTVMYDFKLLIILCHPKSKFTEERRE